MTLFDGHGEPPVTAHVYADGLLGHEATDTSAQAAIAKLPTAGKDAARVLAAIRDHGGLTDDAGEQVLGMRHTTYSARRRGLVLDGRVVDSGRRRLTSAGRSAIVWESVR